MDKPTGYTVEHEGVKITFSKVWLPIEESEIVFDSSFKVKIIPFNIRKDLYYWRGGLLMNSEEERRMLEGIDGNCH